MGLLEHGKLKYTGHTAEGIEHYLACFGDEQGEALISDDENCVESLEIVDATGQPNSNVEHGGKLRIKLTCKVSPTVRYPNVGIVIHGREMQTIAICRSPKASIENTSGRICTEIALGPMVLNPTDYRITVTVHDEAMRSHLIWCSGMWSFRVVGHAKDYGAYVVSFNGQWNASHL